MSMTDPDGSLLAGPQGSLACCSGLTSSQGPWRPEKSFNVN